jgi:hypothetical protein
MVGQMQTASKHLKTLVVFGGVILFAELKKKLSGILYF